MSETPRSPLAPPFDAACHLRVELARMLDLLAGYLAAQRRRGRTPAADAVHGLVIEHGEAEGLITDLADDFSSLRAGIGEQRPPIALREEILKHEDEAARRGEFLPLRHARDVFELALEEYDALLLAIAVEVDARFGRVVAYLNDHVARTRPTLGLALAVAAIEGGEGLSPVGLDARPFIRDGLIELEGDGPMPGLSFKVSPDLVGRLTGETSRVDRPWLTVRPPNATLLERLVLDESTARQLTTWSTQVENAASPVLMAIGTEGTGRGTAVAAALFRGGAPVVQVEIAGEHAVSRLRDARREARWHQAPILVRAGAALPATFDWRTMWHGLPAHRPVALVLTDNQASQAIPSAPTEPVTLRFDEPAVALRGRLWSALLPAGTSVRDSELAELATRFPFGPGGISRAVRRAMADVSLRPPDERRLDFRTLADAARAVDATTLGPLAQKMPLPYARADLIVPPQVSAELDLAVAWVRHRHQVLHEWGFVRRVTMGHGLTALFTGASGTGKTMAAQVLARELNLDLYRIDLSQIMSKYIGDTEKHLASVFGARVGVLFFDEAEVMLGKRHETQEPRDRYANIEIAYLLQRMEEYDGVTVLATNRAQDIDEAFLRRLHVVIDFPLPVEADRLRIWEGMLPATADRAPDLDLRALAREFDISGGQIKNAALAAAYLAAAEQAPIGMAHLRRAARREVVKGGKISDG